MSIEKDSIVTYEEAAKLLSRSVPTIRRIVARENITKQKKNGKVYISAQQIQASFSSPVLKLNRTNNDHFDTNKQALGDHSKLFHKQDKPIDHVTILEHYERQLNQQRSLVRQKDRELVAMRKDCYAFSETTNWLIDEMRELQSEILLMIKSDQLM